MRGQPASFGETSPDHEPLAGVKVETARAVTTLAPFVLCQHLAVKPTPQSNLGRVTALRDLLACDPVCREIVQYLMRNNEAADTARGIAEWWIQRDVSSTSAALSKLQACGVVRSYAVQDNTVVYAYTKKAVLRQSLARDLQEIIVSRSAKEL